jgi:hypothetical protein
MICFFCFYNVSSGIQSQLAFSKTFKHCNLITYDGEIWLATEFDLQGIHTRKIDAQKGSSLIRGIKHIESLIALVVVDVSDKVKVKWKPYIVRSCNELDRYISGVNIGLTFNPKHLYNKLLKYNGSNYEILHAWRR